MKILKLFITAVCISALAFFFLGACGGSDDYYITFKVDGVSKTFDKGFTDYESAPFGNLVDLYGDLFAMYATPDEETGESWPDNYISIMFRGTSTGTYSDTLEASLYYREYGSGWWEGGPVDDIIITVTKYDDMGGVVEGTFSTTIIDEISESITREITEGKFRVKRIADDTLIPPD